MDKQVVIIIVYHCKKSLYMTSKMSMTKLVVSNMQFHSPSTSMLLNKLQCYYCTCPTDYLFLDGYILVILCLTAYTNLLMKMWVCGFIRTVYFTMHSSLK